MLPVFVGQPYARDSFGENPGLKNSDLQSRLRSDGSVMVLPMKRAAQIVRFSGRAASGLENDLEAQRMRGDVLILWSRSDTGQAAFDTDRLRQIFRFPESGLFTA